MYCANWPASYTTDHLHQSFKSSPSSSGRRWTGPPVYVCIRSLSVLPCEGEGVVAGSRLDIVLPLISTSPLYVLRQERRGKVSEGRGGGRSSTWNTSSLYEVLDWTDNRYNTVFLEDEKLSSQQISSDRMWDYSPGEVCLTGSEIVFLEQSWTGSTTSSQCSLPYKIWDRLPWTVYLAGSTTVASEVHLTRSKIILPVLSAWQNDYLPGTVFRGGTVFLLMSIF
jgi:hypothetical protein